MWKNSANFVKCFVVLSALFLNEIHASKCDEKELKGFAKEYEQCHSRALQNLQAQASAYQRQSNPL